MPYNISTIDMVEGHLEITPTRALRWADALPGGIDNLPEGMVDMLNDPAFYMDGCRFKCIPWTGEGSGRTEGELRAFLAICDGSAKLLLCWEGGDAYTGLLVENGTVTEGRVVQTVVPL